MIAPCLTDSYLQKRKIDLADASILRKVAAADVFICAAGFEQRAERVPNAIEVRRNPIVLRFVDGPTQNSKAFAAMAKRFRGVPGFQECAIHLSQPEQFENCFGQVMKAAGGFSSGHIIIDISGMPNFTICETIVSVRSMYPGSSLTLLYTEADQYYPLFADFQKIRGKGFGNSDLFPEFLSARAVTLFIPAMFSGVTLGHNDTCVVVFAGYEPHRTNCVIETLNPSKLVMVYSEPARPDLRWRLELSQFMHKRIGAQVTKAEERTSTSEVGDNLALILQYYEHLFDDHVVCIAPANSKVQAVAAALAWERFRDIQLVFPIPTNYLPRKFSKGFGETFAVDLGGHRAAALDSTLASLVRAS